MNRNNCGALKVEAPLPALPRWDPMADRSRRKMLGRLAIAMSAAAAIGLSGPAALGFEGGHHGSLGSDGGGSHSGALGGLSGGSGGPGGLGGGLRGGGPGPSAAPLPLTGTGGLDGGDHGGRGGGPGGDGPGPAGALIGDDSHDHGPGPGLNGGHGDHGGRAAGRGAGRDGREVEDAVTATGQVVVPGTQARQATIRALLRDHPLSVEADALGFPVVRGEVLAIGANAAALAKARKAGFQVGASESLPELGLQSVVLLAPKGVGAPEALRRIRALDPQGQYDLNHLYQESGVVTAARRGAPRRASKPVGSPAAGLRVGLVDGGVALNLAALSGARIVQRGFAGAPVPSAHATAVASLLAGRQPPFRGAAPGASLYVADVYGGRPTGGSVEAVARALAWMVQVKAPVINISLVGPPNLLLAAAVRALVARGHLVVAAVGNDGPAAPPLYPASYPGVVAVTAVDARRRLLPEAGRAVHVDFAAPGSDMAAAGLDGGFVAVRGTSFAAPIAAGLLARLEPEPSPAAAARALAGLGREAVDVGPRGQDRLYGRGVVGLDLRTPPSLVHARLALRGP